MLCYRPYSQEAQIARDLERMYWASGRILPDHPKHGFYTGLLDEYRSGAEWGRNMHLPWQPEDQ